MNLFAPCLLREETPPASAARTLIVTVLAPRQTVFNHLADIENLPLWAAGFCELVCLRGGGWTALTSLGELFLSLEADSGAGEIVLRAGWEPERLWALTLSVSGGAEGETRIKFLLAASASEPQARLYGAIEPKVRGLAEGWRQGAVMKSTPRP